MKHNSLKYDTDIVVKQIILEKNRFCAEHQMMKYSNVNFSIEDYVRYSERINEELVRRINVDVFGEKNKKEVEFYSSWWQQFKSECMPKWFIKRYPVKYKVIGMFDYLVIYPHLKISLPEERSHLVVLKYEPENNTKSHSK